MKLFAIAISIFLQIPETSLNLLDTENELSYCLTKEGFLGALTEEYLDQAVSYSVQKDYVALQKLIDLKVVFLMKKGVKVYPVDTHIWRGTVEFRLPGETIILWTVIEALEC